MLKITADQNDRLPEKQEQENVVFKLGTLSFINRQLYISPDYDQIYFELISAVTTASWLNTDQDSV